MKTKLIRLTCFLTALVALSTMARAQGSAFTYQGRLSASGAPANGLHDFEFRVFDAATDGTQQGATVTINNLDVTNGLFTATLNPGPGVFTGVDRWLEIGVVTTGGGAFTTLAPRQPLTPTPYAIRAVEAGYAGAATTAGSFTGPLAGDVSGPQAATTVTQVGGESAANVAAGAGAANAATSANTPNTIVKRDGSGNFSVGDITATSFSGSGAGLTSLNAAGLTGSVPIEVLTSVPAANLTGMIADVQLSANVSLLGASIEAAEINDGTITPTDLNLPDFNATFWQATGNAGTTAGTHFLGTTDNQPLEFKVNNQRGLRLEPTGYLDTVNVIGGSALNFVSAGVVGATIGGGGGVDTNFGTGLSYTNGVEANYGTVSGGLQNTIQVNAVGAVVGGGFQNTIEPFADFATIGGGYQNVIPFNGYCASIPGGANNSATTYAYAAGYRAKANHTGAFVWADSTDADFASTGDNQFLIRATGGVGINNNDPNGAALAVNGNVTVNGIIGTPGNQPLELTVNNQRGLRLEPTSYLDTVNVIGGSARNFVRPGVIGATIGGGGGVGTNFGTGLSYTNAVEANFGTVSGGLQNTIQVNAVAAVIGGGFQNTIEPFADFATIGGGYQNVIPFNGYCASIPGGANNSATTYAYAAGYRAKANHTGAFVWADSTDADFASTGDNQFLIRAGGGVGIGTPSPGAPLQIGDSNTPDSQGMMRFASRSGTGGATRFWDIGVPEGDENLADKFYSFVIDDPNHGTEPEVVVRWDTGFVGIGMTNPQSALQVNGTVTATAFNPPSDRNLKENFAPVSPREVLEKVAALAISRWNFIGDAATPHVGPMAQDFHAAFALGTDERHIATVDADGVALAAIQGLNEKVESRNQQAERQMIELKAENAELRNELSDLKQLVQSMSHKLNGGAK